MSARVAVTSASRVRRFCCARPWSSYGVDMTEMVREVPSWYMCTTKEPERAAAMTTASVAQPIVRATDEGDRRWFFGGGVHIWKATAAETDGAFLLFED